MAGLMNQAKRIFEKFDEVLYGPAPEVLVQEAHRSLKTLLQSDEAREFVMGVDLPNDDLDTTQTDFIKRIIESVSPISQSRSEISLSMGSIFALRSIYLEPQSICSLDMCPMSEIRPILLVSPECALPCMLN